VTHDGRSSTAELLDRFGYTSPGFGERYDLGRPSPPARLVDELLDLVGTPRVERVVDLGSGTGLSSAVWVGVGGEVIGIEPSDEMRRVAEKRLHGTTARFVAAVAEDTGLADACADIVSASNSVTWFDPARAYPEIGRILRPRGVFATYFHGWPPKVDPVVDEVSEAHVDRVDALLGREGGGARTDVANAHARLEAAIAASGWFEDIVVRARPDVQRYDVARLLAFVRSSGSATRLAHAGLDDDALGITALEEVLRVVVGSGTVDVELSYTVVTARRSG